MATRHLSDCGFLQLNWLPMAQKGNIWILLAQLTANTPWKPPDFKKKTCTVTYPNNIPYTHLYTNTSMWSLPTKKADHFPFPHGFSTSFSMFTPRSHGDATRVAVPRCHWPRRTSGQCSRCGLAPQIHPTLWKKSWACNGTSHLATGAGSLPSTVCMIIILYIYIYILRIYIYHIYISYIFLLSPKWCLNYINYTHSTHLVACDSIWSKHTRIIC